jgi:hypothetical protein
VLLSTRLRSSFARLAALDETVLRTRRASSARNRMSSTLASSLQVRRKRKMQPLSQSRTMAGICERKSLPFPQLGRVNNLAPKTKGHDLFRVRDLYACSSENRSWWAKGDLNPHVPKDTGT